MAQEETSESQERVEKNAVFSKDLPANVAYVKSHPQYSNPLYEFGLEIPVETVPLPSNGKVYSETHPLHNKDLVEIKAMTAHEEDILTSRALIKNGTVISRLLESMLVDKRINPKQLLSGDRNALIVATRITGYGSAYKFKVECPKCNESIEHTVNLAELPIKRLSIEPDISGENLFSYVLPQTKATVKFKFLTGIDEEQLHLAEDRKKSKGSKEDSIVTTRLLQTLVSINEKTDKNLLFKFVHYMPSMDSLSLRKYIRENEPGIDMTTDLVCDNPDCGVVEKVPVRLDVSFFWPDAR